jgi:hypothetical protein
VICLPRCAPSPCQVVPKEKVSATTKSIKAVTPADHERILGALRRGQRCHSVQQNGSAAVVTRAALPFCGPICRPSPPAPYTKSASEAACPSTAPAARPGGLTFAERVAADAEELDGRLACADATSTGLAQHLGRLSDARRGLPSKLLGHLVGSGPALWIAGT